MNVEREVEEAQVESEASRDLPLPEDAKGRRRGRSVVQSVRLHEADFVAIEQLAKELDVPVGSLIRGWVLDGLAASRGTSLRDAIDHLARDAERLRQLAASRDVA